MKDLIKNALLSLSVLTLMSCGTPRVLVDEELKPYEDWFFALVEQNCEPHQYVKRNNYMIRFIPGKETDERVGVCYNFRVTSRRVIDINRFFWDYTNEMYRKQLIAHELIHCFFNEGHTDEPNHLMGEYLLYYPSVEHVEADVTNYLEDKCNG